MEPRLRSFSQIHGHYRLRDPVRDRRYTERSDPAAVRLGDLHCPDRGREVGARAHPVPYLVKILPKIGFELVQVLLVHSRRPIVIPDPPPRLPDPQLRNLERLVFGL